MSKFAKCDKCGKLEKIPYFKQHEAPPKYCEGWVSIYMATANDYPVHTDIDFCQDCISFAQEYFLVKE